jgi:hypothetical protein
MLPFLHDRVRSLQKLLAASSAVLAKYSRLDLDFAPALGAHLDESIAAFRAMGRTSSENQWLAWQAQFVSASHGTNPLTLERVTSHRREMQRAIALRVLQQSAEQLRADLDRDSATLAEAGNQLRPIVLAAMHKALIVVKAGRAPTQKQLEKFWAAVLADADLQLAARQVMMAVSIYDIQVLLADLIAQAGAVR